MGLASDALTWSTLFNLLGHEGDGGKQFHHYFDNNFPHVRRNGPNGRLGRLGALETIDVNTESSQEVFDCLQ